MYIVNIFITVRCQVSLALEDVPVINVRILIVSYFSNRGNGLGLCTLSSQSGGIISPLITLLTSVWLPLPFLIFGGATLLAGAMSLMLPETKGELMPETIADAEALGRLVAFSNDR